MTPINWLPLLIVAFLAGAYLRLPWLVIFSSAVMLVIGLASLWKHYALERVNYVRRWHYRRGFPGESTEVRIEVENRKWLPVSWLRVSDPWPVNVAPNDEPSLTHSAIADQAHLINLFSLRPFERILRRYKLTFHNRGVYPVGPATLESGDLFGLYTEGKQMETREELTVFPELLPLSILQLPTDDPFGDRASRRRLFEDPNLPMGVRPYRPEDEFRRIHWNATARTGSMQVKVYQPVSSRVMMVCLNVLTTPQPWLGTYKTLFEQLIKMAATLVYHSYQDGYSVGLISNGCLARADHPFMISPGRSSEQLPNLLQALAAVTEYTTSPMENMLIKSMSQVPYGSNLTIITALLPPTLLDTLIRLKRYRPNMLLISLAEEAPPQIPGIRTLHLPFIPSGEKETR